ncbi:protoporphyrinogen oxidase [Lutimaribacter sp. EGI FJ00014]|uniref:Protoporphyrinogen oxidase n=1 Tax=Lutimaribacter degradans TaxID=2945989 RepID=A0ACC5ZRU5_9RHOB|nr:flavodoxin domain-containing protein [Lutimaribacter sp. EGI FJ00013]MCM2560817.1 protoporphyrinogen oxidase [Lutimaribacter sp. EGI FJ00013]MCO0634642.1 protoporphyrinogen oxidase [Lutimaribacter sp. EGI FJ00014]
MILIAYATTEGQTEKIARFCAERLEAGGQAATLLHLQTGAEDMPECDAAILAASVHMGRYQDAIEGFALRHAQALTARRTLFLAVSLAAAGHDADEWADLDRIAQAFQARTGWQAGKTCQVAGAFRFTKYDFFRRLAMRWIAWQKGEEVNPHDDREYTDWAALSTEIDAFAARIA